MLQGAYIPTPRMHAPSFSVPRRKNRRNPVIIANLHASNQCNNPKKMKANEKEFEQIVATYKRTIYTVCYMFSKNEDEVNDLFQDTLVNLWKGMEAFKEQSKLDTWIYRVALNTCISQERKKKRKSARVPMEMDISLYQDNDADTLQVQMLHKRIGRLGMVDRAIVLLWLEDLSYEEIGQIVGISATHVGVKLYRIKELLKRN